MRSIVTLAFVAVVGLSMGSAAYAQKSALDHIQFDGVSSDGELKVERQTRRQWLQTFPVQAKDYWDAWDCKGKICDSTWKANIRKKAALIKRTENDPPLRIDSKTKPKN